MGIEDKNTMSSSQLEEFHRFWARQGTSMSDHHYEERMRFNRETEGKKQRVIDNARLQLENLPKRGLSSTDFDHEARKIGEDRDAALESIEKEHNERMRAVMEIQLKDQANHEKAHKEAVSVRSFMSRTLPTHLPAAAAATTVSPVVDNAGAVKSECTTPGSRTPASKQPGPPSHHRLLGDATPAIGVPREQDRPTVAKKVFSCTAQPLQKFPETRAKQSPHAGSSAVSSALTAKKGTWIPKTITFDEVYQNGEAEYKDTIVEFPAESGKWYILKCEEHGLRFGRGPLRGAGKHLSGRLHGGLERDWATAVKELGYRVTNCNRQLVHMNNKAVDEAFANGYKFPRLDRGKKWKSKRRQINEPNENTAQKASEKASHGVDAIPKLQGAILSADLRSRASSSSSPGGRKTSQPDPNQGITNPKAFNIYYCRWRPNLYPVVILGWDDQKPGGLEIRLSGTGLIDKTSSPPNCYIYHNDAIIGWAPGFEDGGPKVNQRKFPAMFFDNRFAWVSAKWLEKFPLYESDPPQKRSRHFDMARGWIAKKEGFASWEEFEAAQKGKPHEGRGSSVATPSASIVPSTNDSDSESADDSFSASSSSNVTEKELAEIQERAGEIAGDSDYSDSDADSTFGDAQDTWGEAEADGRPWAFYSLRTKARATGQKAALPVSAHKSASATAEATSSAQEGIKMARSISLHACTNLEIESRDEPLKDTSRDPVQDMNGEASSRASVKSSCAAQTTEQADSRVEGSASVCTTRTVDDPTYAPIPPPQSATKPGEIAKGVKRVRSVEPSEIDAGASEQGNGKKHKLDIDTADVQMTMSVASEPLAMPVTPSFKSKVPPGPAAFELSSYRKGLISWNREDERSSARLYYGEGDGIVGTVDGPVNIVIDPKTLRALAQEKIPDSRGNVLVTLLGQNLSEAPTMMVFDKAKGSKMEIGKIQVRGFIRWLKRVNHAVRLLDDRETAEELRKVRDLGALDGDPSSLARYEEP